ncbi:hypothetical protein [Haematospirillum sp. H1815]|uniref:hypothetical protein n=1 Tax=Haematospirillum sp. H1815 TaxID=2723108 RepID=UPI002AC36D7C|nr:hypothetical protein [Haematospirillum sp. H1815]
MHTKPVKGKLCVRRITVAKYAGHPVGWRALWLCRPLPRSVQQGSLVLVSRPSDTVTPVRELVGILPTPDALETCIRSLLKVGFVRTDLSVLAGHDAVGAMGRGEQSWQARLLPLLAETRYEVPVVAGTLIALAGSPGVALVGILAAAGVGLAALKEAFEEYDALPDADDYACAVANGELLLWVLLTDPGDEEKARLVLMEHGARALAIHEQVPAMD